MYENEKASSEAERQPLIYDLQESQKRFAARLKDTVQEQEQNALRHERLQSEANALREAVESLDRAMTALKGSEPRVAVPSGYDR
jgi:predicted nuclease with TOPRIM domain